MIADTELQQILSKSFIPTTGMNSQYRMGDTVLLYRYGFDVMDYINNLRNELSQFRAVLFLHPQTTIRLDILFPFSGKNEIAECLYRLDENGSPVLESHKVRPAYGSDSWILNSPVNEVSQINEA